MQERSTPNQVIQLQKKKACESSGHVTYNYYLSKHTHVENYIMKFVYAVPLIYLAIVSKLSL